MRTLREVNGEYRRTGRGLGHFNFSDSNQLKAIAQAAAEARLPVIAGLSEGERGYFPLAHARSLLGQYRREGVEIYLNADHTYSWEKAKEAIDAGVDSIVVDGAKLPLAQNIALVRKAVGYARHKNFLGLGHRTLVEGELGYIGTSSKVLDRLPEGAAATEEMETTPEAAAHFVAEAGVDCLAPAVGNIHGMIKGGNPKLNIERIAAIAAAAKVPLVLHGGSGSSDEEFVRAIAAGIVVVHINTELRLCYRDSLRQAVAGEETTPYKFLAPPVAAMQKYLVEKMRLFAGGGGMIKV